MSRHAALISATTMLTYLAVALSVGSFYPFSTFPMYANRPHASRAARLGARTARGELLEVTRFRTFDCDATLDVDRFRESCGEAFAPRYLDDNLAHHVRSNAATMEAGEQIAIVWRIFEIEPGGTLAARDCVLAQCRAER